MTPTEAKQHPFSQEAPDAENRDISATINRYVLPEDALSGSSAHVWILVSSTEVTVLSTPAFREWLDETYPVDYDRGLPHVVDELPSVYVVPADRPSSAAPLKIGRWPSLVPGNPHELVAYEAGSSVPFTLYERLSR